MYELASDTHAPSNMDKVTSRLLGTPLLGLRSERVMQQEHGPQLSWHPVYSWTSRQLLFCKSHLTRDRIKPRRMPGPPEPDFVRSSGGQSWDEWGQQVTSRTWRASLREAVFFIRPPELGRDGRRDHPRAGRGTSGPSSGHEAEKASRSLRSVR